MTYADVQVAETRHFLDALGQFDTGMLITQAKNGSLHGRPMTVAYVEQSESEEMACWLWFMVDLETPKMDEIRLNNQVLLTFHNRGDQFLTLSGRAEVIQDAQKVNELWQDGFKAWFPHGKGDPNLGFVRVKAQSGEFWDQGGTCQLSANFDTGSFEI